MTLYSRKKSFRRDLGYMLEDKILSYLMTTLLELKLKNRIRANPVFQ